MLAFTLERYFVVCRPQIMNYHNHRTKMRRVIVLIWLCTSIYCSTWLWLIKTESMDFELKGYEHMERCQFRLSRMQYAYLYTGDLFVFYLAPLIICGILYTKMGRLLCRSIQHQKNIDMRSCQPEETYNLSTQQHVAGGYENSQNRISARIQVISLNGQQCKNITVNLSSFNHSLASHFVENVSP